MATLRGFVRRFWQSSPDHRGTPQAPGRVVTLVKNLGATLRGIAYLVAAEHAAAVLAELDHRERAGYERRQIMLQFADAALGGACALVYQARPENPGFAPSSSSLEIARIVRSASGLSGDNTSYVRRLAQALRDIGEDDPHVFEIERLLDEAP